MIAVAIIGVLASVAASGFLHYVRRARTAEPALHLRQLYDAAVLYHATEHFDAAGALLPRQWPDDTPTHYPETVGACDQPGHRWPPSESYWPHPSMQALGFSIDEPFYFSYDWDPWGGAGMAAGEYFYARALGDQDCDGILAEYRRQGTLDGAGSITAAPMQALNPYE